MRSRVLAFIVAGLLIALAACGDGGDAATSTDANTARSPAASSPGRGNPDGVIEIGGDRSLYVRCTGSGSPTVIMEAGDEDTSDSYAFAEPRIAKVTRTCVYDRANLGRSSPDPGPRGLSELVGDLERLLQAAQVPRPYVLVAGEVDLGDLRAALAAEALLGSLVALGVDGVVAGMQRRLEQRTAQVARALLGDRAAPVAGAGQLDARAEPGVADQLGRRGEPLDVADL
jgi:hypothetical protein